MPATLDFTTALGRLLKDPSLRRDFNRNPQALALTLEIKKEDLPSFLSLDSKQLDTQSQTLMRKRFHEIRPFLPMTFLNIGQRLYPIFEKYASDYWPEGHRRHFQDAVHFGVYLLKHQIEGLQLHELNRLRFISKKKRLSIHFLPNFIAHQNPQKALQILYRTRSEKIHQRFFYFGL